MTTIIHSGLELPAIDGITGGWALDRFSHPQLGMTRTAVVLGRAKVAGMEASAAQLGDRMGSLVHGRSLPADLVVTAVPSPTGINEAFARRVAETLGLTCAELLVGRSGIVSRFDVSVHGRIKPKVRRAPAHVLLVDDAVRTGGTLGGCAAMLRRRGAESVWAVVAVAFGDAAGDVAPFV
jgi:hypothetical protein